MQRGNVHDIKQGAMMRSDGRTTRTDTMRCALWRLLFSIVLVAGWFDTVIAQKTDTVEIIDGTHIVGEIRGLTNGKLELSTWSMSTVYVEWPKVSTVTTDKNFEIQLDDGERMFGSLQSVEEPRQVGLVVGGDTIDVATQSVVDLDRIKPTFWQGLDGRTDLGFDFTQQNAKTDLSLGVSVKYKASLHKYRFVYNSAFSRQDGAKDITGLNTKVTYVKEMKSRMFYGGFLSGESNSQLNLQFRTTIGPGVGRFMAQNNKLNLALWGGLAYAREQYVDEDNESTYPVFISADFEYFVWGALNREFSSSLTLLPLLNSNRWRIQFITSFSWEIASHVYLKLGLNEFYDSNPPSEGANNNDLSFTTSLGWSY